ncbi:MAG: sodium:proton antiporter NhaD [Bacteroidales bacterium]|nr:sodium:proton antiporter NhaD [Bacteroidales bacterium]
MFILMVIVFILGYTIIALEHPLHINKSATALLLGVILWVLFVIGGPEILVNTSHFKHYMEQELGGSFAHWVTGHELLHHLGVISEILFFLLGAMTIVELVDSYEGFRIITDRIKTRHRVKLLWITSTITFFMSAVLDNLTTSIVMVALLRKLIADKKDRWFFAGMVIVAANSGGAWSPIGDITTIMLWIAGKVTTVNIMLMTFLPSLISMVVPLAILSFTMKGVVQRPVLRETSKDDVFLKNWESRLIFFMGVGGLLFVPVFKNLTHLPPYLGMLFSLGVLWTLTEVLQRNRDKESRKLGKRLTIVGVLQKVDVPSVLFFLGILTAVAALDTVGHLHLLSEVLREHVGNYYAINIIIGFLSAIVDNVPLVAGAMGMYNFPPDFFFWEFLAYCAGTGGSILIIGSAAGVAVMGMEKIDFIWYLRRISLLAAIGYLAGGAVYILQEETHVLHGKKDTHAQMIDVSNPQSVMEYLTINEFVLETSENEAKPQTHGESDGSYLRFMRYVDEKTGESYVGYSVKSIDHGDEIWDGRLLQSIFELTPVSDHEAVFQVHDRSFLVRSDGSLFEEQTDETGLITSMVKWKRLVSEGE